LIYQFILIDQQIKKIKAIRDILLLAHRQAFCWTDEWYEKSYESIVEFERQTYAETNEKVLQRIPPPVTSTTPSTSSSNSVVTKIESKPNEIF
jgi:hypothetical protein